MPKQNAPMFDESEPSGEDAKKDTQATTGQPDAQAPPDDQPEVDPITQKFLDQGLDKQFGSPEDMIDRVSDMNRKFTQTSQELAELRRRLEGQEQHRSQQNTTVPEFNYDQFGEDPRAVMDQRYVRSDQYQGTQGQLMRELRDLRTELQQMRLESVQAADPELREYDADMREIYDSIVNAQSDQEQLKALKDLAKLRRSMHTTGSAKPDKPPVDKVPPGQKANAETSSGGTMKKEPRLTTADFAKMTPEQIEQKLGFKAPE